MFADRFLSLWWFSVPEQVLVNPGVLTSPNLHLVMQVAKDTFLDGVCSNHPQVYSPCDCGEPLNNAARDLLKEPLPFDPLDMAKLKALSVFMASIILSLVLAESISHHGVLLSVVFLK